MKKLEIKKTVGRKKVEASEKRIQFSFYEQRKIIDTLGRENAIEICKKALKLEYSKK